MLQFNKHITLHVLWHKTLIADDVMLFKYYCWSASYIHEAMG